MSTRLLNYSILLIVFFGLFSVDHWSQAPNERAAHRSPDWSNLFPQIERCVRKIGPMGYSGKMIQQEASYLYPGGSNSPWCGTITLRFEPGARKSRENKWAEYFPTEKIKVRGFDAWRNSPLCGNDDSGASLEVYFAEDRVLIVGGIPAILAHVEYADYAMLKRIMKASN